MTSDHSSDAEAYVWIWLPGETAPVVCGILAQSNDKYVFRYGQSYLARPNAIPLYDGELPLRPELLYPKENLAIPSCLRDAAPDSWGRRVILNRLSSRSRTHMQGLSELTYLLESGSDRVGALDFQHSASTYKPRLSQNATLAELLSSAAKVEQGLPLQTELDAALLHGTSIGGARPKALIDADAKKYIAKFSSSSDVYSVVKAEFIAMRLADCVGLKVAPVELVNVAGKDVLLIERFDREQTPDGWSRRLVLSGLTLLGLDEMEAPYASYQDLSHLIRRTFADFRIALPELFNRIVFNILCGNNDDHARNHAAFWDGSAPKLTPAYDLCPQSRTGTISTQAMLIHKRDRDSKLATCLRSAADYLLSQEQAIAMVEHQLRALGQHWRSVCDEAQLSQVERNWFWGRQFLNEYAFEDLSGPSEYLKDLAGLIRRAAR